MAKIGRFIALSLQVAYICSSIFAQIAAAGSVQEGKVKESSTIKAEWSTIEQAHKSLWIAIARYNCTYTRKELIQKMNIS